MKTTHLKWERSATISTKLEQKPAVRLFSAITIQRGHRVQKRHRTGHPVPVCLHVIRMRFLIFHHWKYLSQQKKNQWNSLMRSMRIIVPHGKSVVHCVNSVHSSHSTSGLMLQCTNWTPRANLLMRFLRVTLA